MGLLSGLGTAVGAWFGGTPGAAIGGSIGGSLESGGGGGGGGGVNWQSNLYGAAPADFDGALYLAQNPDVARDPFFSTRPYEHYMRHGRTEGRPYPTRAPTVSMPPPSSYLPASGPGDVVGLGNQFLTQLAQRASAGNAPTAMPGGVPVAFPQFPTLPVMGTIPRIGAMVGGAVVRAAGVVRSVAGKIIGFVLPSGRRISRAKAVALARRVGLETAAVALGVTGVELAEAVLEESGKPRRGGGVTAAQMRTTRRTIGKIERLHRQIVSACGQARVPFRRARARWCPPGKRR